MSTGGGNDWNSFIMSRPVQIVMYGACVFFCVFYAVDGILEMMSPERSANMVSMMGAPGYYAMTAIRTVVLAGTAFAFGRMLVKMINEK